MGRGGAEAIAALRAAQRSKTVLSIGVLVTMAQLHRHAHWAVAADAYQLLRELEVSAPTAVQATLDYPTVGAWALRTASALDRQDPVGAEPQKLAAVAAAVAIRADASIRLPLVPDPDARISLPSVGVATLPETAAWIEVRPGPDGPVLIVNGSRVSWTGLPQVRAQHQGRRIDLRFDRLSQPIQPADRDTAAQWEQQVGPGWQVLVDRHAEVAAEFFAAISMLAPLPDPPTGTVSGTSRHAFGAVAMSTPAGPRSVAVTFAHELQHAKLSALMDMFPLIEPGPPGRLYVPWRPDPRPLTGALQGVYAHLSIADFWRREMTAADAPADAQVEFARWREAVSSTADRLLAADRLTGMGQRLVTAVRDETANWPESVPTQAVRTARQSAERHRDVWERAHGTDRPTLND